MTARHEYPSAPAPAGPLILAIGSQDTFLHVYRDQQDLMSDQDIGAGVGEHPFPLEFFDTDGHRLTGVYDGRWHLLRLAPTADPPDPSKVRRRVLGVLAYLRTFVDTRPDVLALYGLTREDAHAMLGPVESAPDLVTAVRWFAALDAEGGHFAPETLGDAHDGGTLHNLTHHGHP
ncbi:MAG TPA: hypothetical protein VGD72_07435 [Mycobacteriales bacterium]|jgi:hypothetical protein